MIIVKDDFFKADLSKLIAKGAEAYQWRYHHKADIEDPTHNKFFVSCLWIDSSEDNFFYMLWKMIRSQVPNVQDCYCWRIIANGQVKGQNANWHTDHGDKTALYFPIVWDPKWGGSIFFKMDGAEKEIKYKQNRLVIFDGNIPHYGSCPTVDNVLRVSIAFNLSVKKAKDATREA